MFKTLSKEEKYILYGIVGIFILGSATHFIYQWTGKNAIIGSVSPVSESVWEHLKLSLIPTLLWYGVYYFFRKQINKNSWFLAMTASFVTTIITMPLLYYFLTGALGIHSVVVDILLFFLVVLLGQLVGLYLYRNGKEIPLSTSLIFYGAIIVMFAVFTVNPPDLPIFHEH